MTQTFKNYTKYLKLKILGHFTKTIKSLLKPAAFTFSMYHISIFWSSSQTLTSIELRALFERIAYVYKVYCERFTIGKVLKNEDGNNSKTQCAKKKHFLYQRKKLHKNSGISSLLKICFWPVLELGPYKCQLIILATKPFEFWTYFEISITTQIFKQLNEMLLTTNATPTGTSAWITNKDTSIEFFFTSQLMLLTLQLIDHH